MVEIKSGVRQQKPGASQTKKINAELLAIKAAIDESLIVAITDNKGKITYANPKFCEISGYSRGELLGQDHRIINSHYHSKEFFCDFWQTITSGRIWRGEIRNRKKNGQFYWVATTIVPFLDKTGKPYQYVAIRHEITHLKLLEEEIKKVSQKIIQTQELERERIAREIHDDLGQSLVSLKMLIQSSLYKTKPNFELSRQKIISSLDAIIDRSRTLAYTLRPATLEILGLKTALTTMIDDLKHQRGLTINLRCGPLNRVTFEGEAINVYRIVQEALHNIISHAKASQVDIEFHKKDEKLIITIQDDGCGFDIKKINKHPIKKDNVKVDSKKMKHGGIGLSTMEERAKLLGGEFSIEARPGHGTLVEVSVPIKNIDEDLRK